MDINPADAALGAAMDSAMDQGGAPQQDPNAGMDDPNAGMDIADIQDMDDPADDDPNAGMA